MRTLITTLVLTTLVGALAHGATYAQANVPATPAKSSVTPAPSACHEDERCWTWSTMGNGRRGVVLKGEGTRVVVGPCRFARLARAGRIDWTRTPRLKGDARAQGVCR